MNRMSHTNLPIHCEPPHDFESIADLIERLGRPPEAIVNQWCRQLRSAAINCLSEGDSPDTSGSTELPEIDLSKWTVLSTGELRCEDRTYPVCSQPVASQPISKESERRIEAFRRKLLESDVTRADDKGSPLLSRHSNTTSSRIPKNKSSDSTRTRPTAKSAGVVSAVLLIVVAIVWWTIRQPSDSIAKGDPIRSAEPSTSLPNPNPESNRFREDATSLSSEATVLETFDSELNDTENDAEAFDDRSSLLAPVNEFVPNLAMPSIHPSPLETDDSDSTSVDKAIMPSVNELKKGDALEEEPVTSAAEKPQPVRLAKVQAITLPATSGEEASNSIEGLSSDNLFLDFPYPIDLRLEEQPSDRAYLIRDGKDRQTIATLRADDSGQFVFAWDKEGKKRPVANLLQHGRLKDGNGHTLYLRPCIEADPWTMPFAESDYQPTWDLGGMIPPQVSRLSVEFELPDEIEVGWIEPVQGDRPRSSRALAVLSHKEFEFVQVAVLLNMRCSRKFAVKIRFAARLDPALPWQTFTEAGLTQWSSQLLQHSGLLEQQRNRLEAIYAQADTLGRRNLQDNRENMKAQIEWVTKITTRAAQLQAMVTTLGVQGKLRFEIVCRWPDTDQKILTMTPLP